MTKDAARSRSVANRVRAIAKCCFASCQKAVARLPELAKATYVEGIAVCPQSRLPLEHAWIELDGVVIDPTLPDRQLAYFAGILVAGRDGLTAAKSGRKGRGRDAWEPLFYQYGFGGYGYLGFVTCARAAKSTSRRVRVRGLRIPRVRHRQGRSRAVRLRRAA